MSSVLTLDNKTTRRFQKLEPHVNGFSMDKPLEVSGNVWLPKPMVATISNWMSDKVHTVTDSSKLQKMQALFNQH